MQVAACLLPTHSQPTFPNGTAHVHFPAVPEKPEALSHQGPPTLNPIASHAPRASVYSVNCMFATNVLHASAHMRLVFRARNTTNNDANTVSTLSRERSEARGASSERTAQSIGPSGNLL